MTEADDRESTLQTSFRNRPYSTDTDDLRIHPRTITTAEDHRICYTL